MSGRKKDSVVKKSAKKGVVKDENITSNSKKEKVSEELIKSKSRVKQYGEVFTPSNIVKQMCDLCEPEISAIDKKIFEPTCGNGNFLIEILRRKLSKIKYKNKKQYEFDIIFAVSNIYGVDIQADNVEESKNRMKSVVFDVISKNQKIKHNSFEFLKALDVVLSKTILIGNTLMEKDSLTFYEFIPDYDNYIFEITPHTLTEIEKYYSKTKKTDLKNIENLFNGVDYSLDVSPPKTKTAKKSIKKLPEKTSKKKDNGQASLF